MPKYKKAIPTIMTIPFTNHQGKILNKLNRISISSEPTEPSPTPKKLNFSLKFSFFNLKMELNKMTIPHTIHKMAKNKVNTHSPTTNI